MHRRQVSIHAPTWGATHAIIHHNGTTTVSIHAPTWGATTRFALLRGRQIVSIHAPTWGATAVAENNVWTILVSIHAPTWGATFTIASRTGAIWFQFTHPRGVRLIRYIYHTIIYRFQFTHPRGVRPSNILSAFATACFNSRTHVGCDNGLPVDNTTGAVSIHAPTWGATQQSRSAKIKRKRFNSRTHVGCDSPYRNTLRYGILYKRKREADPIYCNNQMNFALKMLNLLVFSECDSL